MASPGNQGLVGSGKAESARAEKKSAEETTARRTVNLTERYQVRDWTRILGVGEEELRRAVLRVGTSEEAVRRYFERGRGI